MKFRSGVSRSVKEIQKSVQLAGKLYEADRTMDLSCLSHVRQLACWLDSKKPFFNVYPTVVECLKNTDHKVDPGLIPESAVHRLRSVDVRTPEGCGVEPFLLSILPTTPTPSLELVIEKPDGSANFQAVPFGKIPSERYSGRPGSDPVTKSDSDELTAALKLAIGVLFLAADPHYIDPVLLSRDKGRELDEDAMERAIKRAKNRGVFGFDIGKSVEVSPHFRRPHFAIRWTGKGRYVPRLVPVRGAMVNHRLVEKIPTGYGDEQG